MEWIENFKIALIEENIDELSSLLSSMPKFETVEECHKAMALISQARNIIIEKREILSKQMQQLEKSRKFLLSSKNLTDHKRLDIHS